MQHGAHQARIEQALGAIKGKPLVVAGDGVAARVISQRDLRHPGWIVDAAQALRGGINDIAPVAAVEVVAAQIIQWVVFQQRRAEAAGCGGRAQSIQAIVSEGLAVDGAGRAIAELKRVGIFVIAERGIDHGTAAQGIAALQRQATAVLRACVSDAIAVVEARERAIAVAADGVGKAADLTRLAQGIRVEADRQPARVTERGHAGVGVVTPAQIKTLAIHGQ